MDLGADRRGVEVGPFVIGYVDLTEQPEAIGASCADGGDIPVPRLEGRDPGAAGFDGRRAKFRRETREARVDVGTAVGSLSSSATVSTDGLVVVTPSPAGASSLSTTSETAATTRPTGSGGAMAS